MAVVVIGIEGSPDLWIADLEAGTVTKLDAPTGKLAEANVLATSGATVTKGIKMAISVSSSKEIFSGHVES